MLLLRSTIFSFCLIFLIALSLCRIGATEAKTAVLFGATGAVGNEVLRAILANNNQMFTTLILVGRRSFPPKVNDLLSSSSDDHPLEVIKVEDVADLGIVDQHDVLAAMKVDACFIAVGNAFPQQSDLYDWHLVDVTMAESMTRLCVQMQTTVITLFTAIDADQLDPEPYSEEELTKTGTPMGWWPVLAGTMRMMGWKEKAVATAAVKKATAAVKIPPSIRIFQPSNIITKEMRYGWLDWTVFNFHAVFDPWLPTRYHSVTTELLATAMVTDSVHILSGRTPSASASTTTVGDVGEDRATRFTYGDFLRIVAGEDVGEEKTEL